MIAAGTSVHANLLPFSIGKPIEHAVVQLNECIQQSAGRIKLECQASFGEIDLHARGVGIQTVANIVRRSLNKIFQEHLARISAQSVLRIEQARSEERRVLKE